MTIHLLFGNPAPHQMLNPFRHGTTEDLGVVIGDPALGDMVRLDPIVSSTTEIHVDASTGLAQALKNVELAWKHHSYDAPGWVTVASDRAEDDIADFESALRIMLGIPRKPAGPVALVTNAGLDFISKQLAGTTASATAVAKWVALTANSTAPAAGDTALTGEIATASGGLIRAAGTYAHTAAASTYTVSNTFTANANDTLPVTVAKAGTFDAASTGNMPFETLLSATATLSAIGDNIPLTWTVTV